MKFKRGDKVRVRQWEAMEREFGSYDSGLLKTPVYCFSPDMAKYCGKSVTIDFVIISEGCSSYYSIIEDGGNFKWTDAMFEGYAFEYGDKIEVSDDEIEWADAIYISFADGSLWPYICVGKSSESDFHSNKEFTTGSWKYARPIQRHRIVIDGKEIEISEESYKKLKESLLK